MSARDHDGEIIYFNRLIATDTRNDCDDNHFGRQSKPPPALLHISLVSRNKIGMATFQIFNHTIVSYVRR